MLKISDDVVTFYLRYDLIIQCIQSLGTGPAHVQILGLYHEVNSSYTFLNESGYIADISDKFYNNVQVKTVQNICNLDVFQSFVDEKSKLCFSVIKLLKFTYCKRKYVITLCI